MRWIGWLLVLVGIVCLAVAISATGVFSESAYEGAPDAGVAQGSPPAGQTPDWRRTAHGWQRATWLSRPVEYRRPALHPAIFGMLLTLLALAAAVLLDEGRKAEGGGRKAEGGRGKENQTRIETA